MNATYASAPWLPKALKWREPTRHSCRQAGRQGQYLQADRQAVVRGRQAGRQAGRQGQYLQADRQAGRQ